MVKTPRARHSTRKKEPVTIELGPDQVSRITDRAGPVEEAKAESVAPESGATKTANAEPADEAAAGGEGIDSGASSDRTGSFTFASNHDADNAGYPIMGEPASASRSASSGGFGGALAAGVAGGVIALVLAGGLQWAGFVPALGNGGDQAALHSLRADVDALEQEVTSFDAGTVDAETIKQALAPADKRIGELASEVEQVKKDVAAARSSAASGGSADSAALTGVQDRLAKLEQSVAAAGKTAPSAQTVDALDQKVSSLGQTAAANSDGLKKLEQSIAALGGKVAEQANEPHATAAIAASALKSAVDRGGSFAAELDMFAAVAPDTPELDELRALAAKGVPTRAQLASEVAPVADRMLDATRRTAASDGGVVDRLIASAQSLVRVRPVGKVEGDGVAARIARFHDAVTGGDLAKAAGEYDALPEQAKAAGADFMAGLQARLKADTLAQKALASVLKAG